MKSVFVRVFPVIMAAALTLSGQNRGGGAAGGGASRQPGNPGNSTPGLGTPGNSPNPSIPNNPRLPGTVDRDSTRIPEMARPLYFSGKVMLDDGTAPPDAAAIQTVCGGQYRTEGYTDSKGRFSIEYGKNAMSYMDASESGPSHIGPGRVPGGDPYGTVSRTGERNLMGCELRASLPGFRSDVVNLGTRRSLDNPDVGVIILHRLANVEGLTISATSAMAPKDAKKAFDKARNAARKGKFEDAQRDLEKAVELYPKYAAAWFELGRVQEQQKESAGARTSYSKSIESDSKFVNPYERLAAMALHERNWQEAADTSDRALKLNPYNFPQLWLFNAVANLNLHKLDAAERSAREAVKTDAEHNVPKSNQVLGIILAQKSDFSGAAEQMRAYLQFAPGAPDRAAVQKQLAALEQSLNASASTPTGGTADRKQ